MICDVLKYVGKFPSFLIADDPQALKFWETIRKLDIFISITAMPTLKMAKILALHPLLPMLLRP